jgi:hypothetical protein
MTQTVQNQNLVYLTARISFPNIVDPQTQTDPKTGETKKSYNCDLIMPPNDPGFQKFMQTYQMLAQEKWKEHANQVMQMIQADKKARCYGAGNDKVSKKTFAVHKGYADNVFITARSERQPQIIDTDGKPVDPANTMAIRAEASRLSGGVLVNAVCRVWLQSNTHGQGVRCDLIAIQFAQDDGTRFGSEVTDVTNMFGAVAGAAPAAPVGFAPVAMPAAPFAAAPQPQMTVPGGYPPAPLGMPSFMQG